MLFFLLFSQVVADSHTICDPDNSKCYVFVENLNGFAKAESDCNEVFGHLTSIENAEENEFLNGIASSVFLETKANSFWIGANHFGNIFDSDWQWINDVKWSYTNWETDEPSLLTCAAVNTTTGQWVSSQAYEKKPSICALPAAPGKIPSCTEGWTANNITNACYLPVFNVTFEEAENQCISMGAHLASIPAAIDKDWIGGMTKLGYYTELNQMTWIGLTYGNGKWQWTDGSPLDYTNWEPGMPVDPPGLSTCGLIYSDPLVGKLSTWNEWTTTFCWTKLRAGLCQKPAIMI